MSVGESVTIGAGVPEFTFIQFVCSGRDTPTKSPSRHINMGPTRAMLGLHGYQVGMSLKYKSCFWGANVGLYLGHKWGIQVMGLNG